MLNAQLSLTELRRSEHLPKPYDDWRLVQKPVPGHINGLETIRGLAVATNGIIVALLNSYGKISFGHLEWFVKDKPSDETDLFDGAAVTPRATRSKRLDALAEFTEAV